MESTNVAVIAPARPSKAISGAERALLCAAALTVIGLGVLVLIAPDLLATQVAGRFAQALGEGAGALACARTARALAGRARLTWGLFATGLGVWAITDAVVGWGLLVGIDPAAPGPFDPSWLSFYAFMFAGVLLLYGRMRPERGWQGVLDGALVAIALGLFGWHFLLGPIAAGAQGGALGTLVNMLYPICDLACLTALCWVVARHRSDAPAWLWWIVAGFGLQLVADVSYLTSYLHGLESIGGFSAVAYTAAGWVWAMAAHRRLRTGSIRAWGAGSHSAPPSWSRAVPMALGLAVIGLVIGDNGWIGVAVFVSVVIAAVRMATTLQVNAHLITERDRLLVTDPLTGAHNRRFLDMELARAFARVSRSEIPLAVIAFDLDRFKEINDTHGHGAGDELLVGVARAASAQLRLGDLLFRQGGDEFLILLPGADGPSALGIAERVRVAIREEAQRLFPDAGVTASFGVSSIPELVVEPEDLVRTADQALYWAKADGRDRVCTFGRAESGARARRVALAAHAEGV
jgi:diguanylate cyclase (GGDEF)-like protein